MKELNELGVFNLVMALAAIGAVLVYFFQWEAMKAGLRETRNAVDAARRQAEAAEQMLIVTRRSIEPIVMLRPEPLPSWGSNTVRAFVMMMKNAGGGVATDCEARLKGTVQTGVSGHEWSPASIDNVPTQGVLPPASDEVRLSKKGPLLKPPDWEAFGTSRLAVFCQCEVTYRSSSGLRPHASLLLHGRCRNRLAAMQDAFGDRSAGTRMKVSAGRPASCRAFAALRPRGVAVADAER